MYQVNADQPRELTGLPQSCIGAPCPIVWADEHSLYLAYYLETVNRDWDGASVRDVSESNADEPIAVVSFKHSYAHMFGPPNDEAFSGHPLASRGVQPYAAYEVANSSWIHSLERMNSVHQYHQPERFEAYKHYIFTFHDSTFECVAEGFTLSRATGNVRSALLRVTNRADD